MKIALVAAKSLKDNLEENINTLTRWVKQAKAEQAELVLFGEAYLQGFEALSFDYQEDIEKCLSEGSQVLAKLRHLAKEESLAIGFGYFENHRGAIYGSYMLLGDQGEVLLNYRRVSQGWRLPEACADYREGKEFKSFHYRDKSFALMVCGDFWEDELLPSLIDFDNKVDAYLWPVHCDYELDFWQESEEDEYRKRTAILASPVLFINNYSPEEERAKGGLYHWHQGHTVARKPMGEEGMLLVEI